MPAPKGVAQKHRVTTLYHRDDSWKEKGICQHEDPDLFYTDEAHSGAHKPAIAVCSDCPVRVACLQYALKNEEQYGVWGGSTPNQRIELFRAARKARRSL